MTAISRYSVRLIIVCLLFLPLLALAQKDKAGDQVEELPPRSKTVTQREFYEMQVSMEQLRRQMNELRLAVEAYRSREMTPEVYRIIMNRLRPPKLTHEIVLTNGTVVRGNILKEDIKELTLETALGNLTLSKSQVRTINEVGEYKPQIEFVGDAREQIFDDHRIYTGKIRNDGVSRGDFVRVIFKLWSAGTELVATDSAFVDGKNMAYISGVLTDTAIDPGQEAEYHVRVNVAKDNPVSYITREIHAATVD